MLNLAHLQPTEHSAKKILRKNGISNFIFSRAIGISSSYASQILKGWTTPTGEIENKIQKLIREIETGGSHGKKN